ncbi:MAG: hypothetical protein HRT99_04145 [Mycoplasmatales bacterium]|nr:hypothetical protein [Mycoplasmatales bacterium]
MKHNYYLRLSGQPVGMKYVDVYISADGNYAKGIFETIDKYVPKHMEEEMKQAGRFNKITLIRKSIKKYETKQTKDMKWLYGGK